MFDPIKLMGMLKKANDLKKKVESELKSICAEGSAGNGMVQVKINGKFDVEKVVIDPDIFNQGDERFLEDLVKSSVNDAISKIKNTLIDKIKNMFNTLNVL